MSLIYHCDDCGKAWVVQPGTPQQFRFGMELAEAVATAHDSHNCPKASSKVPLSVS